jgi:hypothetical protein
MRAPYRTKNPNCGCHSPESHRGGKPGVSFTAGGMRFPFWAFPSRGPASSKILSAKRPERLFATRPQGRTSLADVWGRCRRLILENNNPYFENCSGDRPTGTRGRNWSPKISARESRFLELESQPDHVGNISGIRSIANAEDLANLSSELSPGRLREAHFLEKTFSSPERSGQLKGKSSLILDNFSGRRL